MKKMPVYGYGWVVLGLFLAQGLGAAELSKAPDATQVWRDLQTKAVLNGKVQASVSYQGKEAQVLVLSKKRFHTAAEQGRAVEAARLIQRDVAVFCGSHCQALPMPSPQLQAGGQLRFVLRLTGLGRQLFQEELQALLSGSTGLPAAQPDGALERSSAAPLSGKNPASRSSI